MNDPESLRSLYPFSPRSLENIKIPEPKSRDNAPTGGLKRKLNMRDYTVILATFVGSLIVMISVLSLNSTNDLRGRASSNKVNFYLYPKNVSLEVGSNILLSPKLQAFGTSKISEVRATIAFNPSQLRLDKLVLQAINDPTISYQSSSITNANLEGKIKILLKPELAGNFMSGIINLPQLQMTKIATGLSGVSIVSMETKVTQINGTVAEIETDKPTLIYTK